MKLVLIRHTSVAVPKGVCYGQTDVPLAESFPEEASKVKENLEKYKFDKVVCSPLSRCVKLAEFCGYPDAVRDDRLKEMNFGKWEMKSYDELMGPELREWFDDYINVVPPEGESVIQQQERFLDFIESLGDKSKNETIGLFTHGGILINALVALDGKSFDEVYNAIPPYGSIIEIDI